MVLLVCVLAGSSHTALADSSHPGFAQLNLTVSDGTWVTGEGDPWFASTTETTSDSFTLSITNKQDKSAAYLHLLVASNIIDDGNFSISMSIDGAEVVIPEQVFIPNKILALNYYNPYYIQIGNDGIYPIYYQDVNLSRGIGGLETVNVIVVITLGDLSEDLKIHFDAVGVDDDEMPVLKAANAHDVTYRCAAAPIPEFPTIALPVLSILGLMFIISKKYR